jgi:hypothetical protein
MPLLHPGPSSSSAIPSKLRIGAGIEDCGLTELDACDALLEGERIGNPGQTGSSLKGEETAWEVAVPTVMVHPGGNCATPRAVRVRSKTDAHVRTRTAVRMGRSNLSACELWI